MIFGNKGKRYIGCLGPVSRPIAKIQYARIRLDVVEGREIAPR